MWSIRDATPADAETLFWRAGPEVQERYKPNPVTQLQWQVMDSQWVKVLEYPESGPVGVLGAIPLARGKGLLWSLSTPMGLSRPIWLVKALKRAISELETEFPGGLCGVAENPREARFWSRRGFLLGDPVDIAGRRVIPMEMM